MGGDLKRKKEPVFWLFFFSKFFDILGTSSIFLTFLLVLVGVIVSFNGTIVGV